MCLLELGFVCMCVCIRLCGFCMAVSLSFFIHRNKKKKPETGTLTFQLYLNLLFGGKTLIETTTMMMMMMKVPQGVAAMTPVVEDRGLSMDWSSSSCAQSKWLILQPSSTHSFPLTLWPWKSNQD